MQLQINGLPRKSITVKFCSGANVPLCTVESMLCDIRKSFRFIWNWNIFSGRYFILLFSRLKYVNSVRLENNSFVTLYIWLLLKSRYASLLCFLNTSSCNSWIWLWLRSRCVRLDNWSNTPLSKCCMKQCWKIRIDTLTSFTGYCLACKFWKWKSEQFISYGRSLQYRVSGFETWVMYTMINKTFCLTRINCIFDRNELLHCYEPQNHVSSDSVLNVRPGYEETAFIK